jgi:hypothetical protein
MASNTKHVENVRKRKRTTSGTKRKAKLGRKSTLSAAELFAAVDQAAAPKK